MTDLKQYSTKVIESNNSLKREIFKFLLIYKQNVQNIADALKKHKRAIITYETDIVDLDKQLKTSLVPINLRKQIDRINKERNKVHRITTIQVVKSLSIVYIYLDAIGDKINETVPKEKTEGNILVLKGLQQIRMEMEAARNKFDSVEKLYHKYVVGKRRIISAYLKMPVVIDKTRAEILNRQSDTDCSSGTMIASDVGIWFPVKDLQNTKSKGFFGSYKFKMIDFISGKTMGPYKPGNTFAGVIVVGPNKYNITNSDQVGNEWYYVDDRHVNESMEAYRLRIMHGFLDEQNIKDSTNIKQMTKNDSTAKKIKMNIASYAQNTKIKNYKEFKNVESKLRKTSTCTLTYMGDGYGETDEGILKLIHEVINTWVYRTIQDPSVSLDFLTPSYKGPPLVSNSSGMTSTITGTGTGTGTTVSGGGYNLSLPVLFADYNPKRDLAILLTHAFKKGVDFRKIL